MNSRLGAAIAVPVKRTESFWQELSGFGSYAKTVIFSEFKCLEKMSHFSTVEIPYFIFFNIFSYEIACIIMHLFTYIYFVM